MTNDNGVYRGDKEDASAPNKIVFTPRKRFDSSAMRKLPVQTYTPENKYKEAQDNKQLGIKIAAVNRDAALIVSAMITAGFSQKVLASPEAEKVIKEELSKWKNYLWKKYDDVE